MAVADNDVQMQTDIDAHAAAGAAVAAAAAIPTPTTPPPELVVSPQTTGNSEVLMQQQFMKFIQGMFASMAATSSPSGAAGSSPSGVQSVPGGGGQWCRALGKCWAGRACVQEARPLL